MQRIICFVSDFGLDDTWVGVCHAVIHRACPQARVVDLAHQLPPFDIRKGAAVAASGAWQLPEAIHLVVVDPGVGGGRHDLCLVTNRGTILVGPDNGVLVPATWRAGGIAEAIALDPSRIGAHPVLPTFHARDILAPAAAALACGVEPKALGDALDIETLAPAPFERGRREGQMLVAEVLDLDRFGSIRLGVELADLEGLAAEGEGIELSFGHLTVRAPVARTFSDVDEGDPVTLIDSSGWLTLALRADSAAERWGIEPGDPVRIRKPA